MSEGTGAPGRGTVLRSTGSFVLGIVGTVVLLVIGIQAGWSEPAGLGVALLAAASCHVLLTRPHVRIDEHGVSLANPLRWVRIPWGLFDEATSRWNLEIHTDSERFTSWALQAQIRRPRGVVGPLLPGRRLWNADGDSARADEAGRSTPGSMSAQSAKALIEQAHSEWGEMVADGHLSRPQHPAVERGWDLRGLLLLGVPAVVTAAGLVT